MSHTHPIQIWIQPLRISLATRRRSRAVWSSDGRFGRARFFALFEVCFLLHLPPPAGVHSAGGRARAGGGGRVGGRARGGQAGAGRARERGGAGARGGARASLPLRAARALLCARARESVRGCARVRASERARTLGWWWGRVFAARLHWRRQLKCGPRTLPQTHTRHRRRPSSPDGSAGSLALTVGGDGTGPVEGLHAEAAAPLPAQLPPPSSGGAWRHRRRALRRGRG